MKMRNVLPWWGWGAWLLSLAAGLAAYPHLPARVAIHYNASGIANGYGSRLEGVLILPAVMLGVILLWPLLRLIDPKRKNYDSFLPTYRYLGGIIVIFLGLVHLWMLAQALHFASISDARVAPTLVGLLIALMSNVLPRVQSNWLVGIRTPWTLSSERSWRLTHRLAGNLGVPIGIVMVILAWALPVPALMWAYIGPLLVWAAVSVIASYFYARG